MKYLVAALITLLFISCSKESVSPSTPSQPAVSSSIISFQNDYISITNFKAQPDDSKVSVGFITNFQKGVKTLEILRGVTSENLCSIYKTSISSDSYSTLQYSTTDTTKSSTLYFIVKYTLDNNDWGYTPMYKLNSH